MTGELEATQLRNRVTQLEGKVAYLYRHLGMNFAAEPRPTDDPRVVDELKKGNLLKAVAAYRQINNVDLEDAQQAVQEMQGRLGL